VQELQQPKELPVYSIYYTDSCLDTRIRTDGCVNRFWEFAALKQ